MTTPELKPHTRPDEGEHVTEATVETETHLWDVEHDYYCSGGDYFQRGMFAEYRTWGDFIAAEGENDLDMNLLFRWDWLKGDEGVMGTLDLFFCLQRKGAQRSVRVTVHPDEESLVRAYLQPRYEHLARLWAPLAPVSAGESEDQWRTAFESLHARLLRDLPGDASELPQPDDEFWARQLDELVTYASELYRETETEGAR